MRRILVRVLYGGAVAACAFMAATAGAVPANAQPAACAPSSEGFDDITTLPGSGWAMINNSAPTGTTGWFQGNPTVFTAQGGLLPTSYIAANFNNTAGIGTISNWLLTPVMTLQNGAQLDFWTRTATLSMFPDRLQVRMSLDGSSINVGSTATSVGDFTALLLDINPTYAVGGYPDLMWTQFTVTLGGIASPTDGRLAFRYFVENGGPNGDNSNYIGIDTMSYTCPVTVVALVSLAARSAGRGVTVRWRTTSAAAFAGFDVFADEGRTRRRLSARLIPAVQGAHTYSYLVRQASGRSSRGAYWVRAVRLDGSAAWFGPVSVRN